MKRVLNNFKNTNKKSLFLMGSILYLEIIFIVLISKNITFQLGLNIVFTTIILTKILSIIIGLFKEKGGVITTSIILLFLGVIFSVQGVFYKIFKIYFSLYNLALNDQVNNFMDDAIKLIAKNSIYILFFMLPFITFLVFHKNLKKTLTRNTKGNFIYILITLLVWIGIQDCYTLITKNDRYSNYELTYNVNSVSLNIKRVGVLKNYKIELMRCIFGFKPKKIEAVKIEEEKKIGEQVEEKIYEENKLQLNLNDTGNSNIDTINAYMRSDTPTLKNKYTGMFKGYNLVYITAESFSEIGVSKELTPTLYKLTHSGFIFNNFYTPNNLSTIGGEFQTLTGLYPDASILSKWRSGTNTFPYGLANAFSAQGYKTFAYHNNSYVFQDRNQYIASQGFTNFLGCYNGLEKRINCGRWPQSDNEMMTTTIGDYKNSESPFLAYYMTVSGHLGYTYNDNSISYEHRDLVDHLDVNENAKAYIATQIELDKALETLISELEKENKLDNTVIVLQADHYPYGLDLDTINSISTYQRDETIEMNHNALIIWNNKLEDTIIDKPCMSVDVIPTVYNLFGIDYDSRLYSGKDILSTSFGVAVMADRSWVTSKGKYYAPSNKFIPTTDESIDQEYIDTVNNLINSRLNISRMILENDYYKYITR